MGLHPNPILAGVTLLPAQTQVLSTLQLYRPVPGPLYTRTGCHEQVGLYRPRPTTPGASPAPSRPPPHPTPPCPAQAPAPPPSDLGPPPAPAPPPALSLGSCGQEAGCWQESAARMAEAQPRLNVASWTQAPRRWVEAELQPGAEKVGRSLTQDSQEKQGGTQYCKGSVCGQELRLCGIQGGHPGGLPGGGGALRRARFGEQTVCACPALGSPAPDQGLCGWSCSGSTLGARQGGLVGSSGAPQPGKAGRQPCQTQSWPWACPSRPTA